MAARRDEVTPALNALAELTGTDPDALRRHPQLVLRALREAGADVVATSLDLSDEDPAVRQAAEARRDAIRDVLTRRPLPQQPYRDRFAELLDRATAALRASGDEINRGRGRRAGPAG